MTRSSGLFLLCLLAAFVIGWGIAAAIGMMGGVV